jgi:hypothetical protein
MSKCDAVDFHFNTKTPLFDQFLFLTRYRDIGGIGVYPYWKKQGFHIDLRPGRRAYWMRNQDGVYKAITIDTFRREDE